MQRILVCAVDALPPGEARRVECDPVIAVFNQGGEFFALADLCTHGQASLSEGYIEDDCTIECPVHSAKFSLKTGKALTQPANIDAPTFQVEVEDGQVYVLAPAQRAT